jgi:hypothetical protein
MKTAAVDSSGNLLLKNIANVVGTTVTPTSAGTTFSVIPEMTVTVTTNGNKVLITFSGTMILPSGGLSVNFAIFKDGTQINKQVGANSGSSTTSERQVVTLTYVDSATAASHTYDVRWNPAGASIASQLTERQLQVVELG